MSVVGHLVKENQRSLLMAGPCRAPNKHKMKLFMPGACVQPCRTVSICNLPTGKPPSSKGPSIWQKGTRTALRAPPSSSLPSASSRSLLHTHHCFSSSQPPCPRSMLANPLQRAPPITAFWETAGILVCFHRTTPSSQAQVRSKLWMLDPWAPGNVVLLVRVDHEDWRCPRLPHSQQSSFPTTPFYPAA